MEKKGLNICEQIKQVFKKIKNAGVDGLIIVDLPYEESEFFYNKLKDIDLDLIRLISPTTPKKTIEKIVKFSSGFLYYVSFRGVTGAKLSNFKEVQDNVKYIKSKTKLPVVVGFGIKEGEIAQKMSKISDGVVIGSRLIDIVQQNNFRLNDSLKFLEKSLKKFRRDVRKK